MEAAEQSNIPYDPQPGDCVWTTEIAPGTDVEIKRGAARAIVMREYAKDKSMVEVEYGGCFDRAIITKRSCTFVKHGKPPMQSWIDNPPVFT